MMERIILNIGETKRFRKGIFSGVSIMYCGMSDENTFSIGLKQARGNQGYGLNLYFPKGQSNIVINEVKLSVDQVSPQQITISNHS